jgi:hypothetical protein
MQALPGQGPSVIKLFFLRNLQMFQKTSVFATAGLSSLVYSKGELVDLPSNIRLGWKGLSGINILAH